MIDQFTKQQFENYLQSNHSPFESLGLINGEEAYSLPLDNQVSITIRSSVRSDGLSADVGKDSIRVWLMNGDKPLGSKVSKWTTRQPGWQDRLSANIKQLVLWRALSGDCEECGLPKGIFKARTEQNKGRPFTRCRAFTRCREHNGFMWLDEPIEKKDIYFSEKSGEKNGSTNKESGTEKDNVAHCRDGVRLGGIMPNQPTNSQDSNVSEASGRTASVQKLPKKEPNKAQKQAIEADTNADLRVLAGPGSGKTFVIEHRYKYLVDDNVSPDSILVCTFSKAMADEMGKRIQATCPNANLDQISTIHAFCYRLLCRWYPDSRYHKWSVPKDWQVKKCLEDAIGLVWEKEKPSANEVLNYIDTSKYLGLSTDDSYLWFVDVLGQQYGAWLYEIRSKFDAWLARNRSLTFTDMLFLVEQRLKSDDAWRTMLQERFSHVIIDESQDTNYQAMRILVTVSLEPGMNSVYDVKAEMEMT